MRVGFFLSVLAVAVLLPTFGCGQTSRERGLLDSITVERSRLYVETLASDSLGGRRTETPGGIAAAKLIAEWLAEAGAVPFAGESYMQPFGPKQVEAAGFYFDPESLPLVCNVLGKIEGTESDEYVFVGAHYDHEGTRPDEAGGDTIFNGADDNASGVAGVLQIARAFAASGERPRRTVVFALWDAE
jgi:acetylornithine deacetylase/succinyl-diaminopimelate desuccinylase-like protein